MCQRVYRTTFYNAKNWISIILDCGMTWSKASSMTLSVISCTSLWTRNWWVSQKFLCLYSSQWSSGITAAVSNCQWYLTPVGVTSNSESISVRPKSHRSRSRCLQVRKNTCAIKWKRLIVFVWNLVQSWQPTHENLLVSLERKKNSGSACMGHARNSCRCCYLLLQWYCYFAESSIGI